MQLVIGRIAKAHGIGGEVSVDVRTDAVEARFAVGAQVETDPPAAGPLTIESMRWHTGRLLIGFVEVQDRNAAEALRGTMLVADSGSSPASDDDEFWDHDLVGLRAILPDGSPLGVVSEIVHMPGSDLLSIKRPSGELLVPFVAAIVPNVDIAAGTMTVDPPEGLLEL